MKTHIQREPATSELAKRSPVAARGAKGWAQARADRERISKVLRIQPKLAIGEPGDVHEQEADHVADQVVRMRDPAMQCASPALSSGASIGPPIQRLTDRSSAGAGSVPDDFVRDLGPGRPLDGSTRAFFEPRFGRGFEDVRVHTGPGAADRAQGIHARAFTAGPNIVFGRDQYRPDSREGQRLLAHELTHVVQQREAGAAMIQGDFTSDFAGKEAVAATPGRPQPSGTVRVQTYATQTTSAIWVDAPYGIYSPKEIPEAYQDRIMESGKAFQWRNPRVPLGEAAQREMERGANAGELTVRDMRNLAQGAGRNMNIRVAMAKIGNDFRFVGYDMSVGSTGQPVSGGFVETEAGTTRGVGQALFVDRVVRALSNRAEGMQLEVYHSQRTENFHARIFAVAGRQGTPTEGQHYTLSTGEMIRVALAWSEKLTVAQRQDLTALLARRPNPTALEADAALWRGSAVRPGGTQRVPSSQTVTGVTGSGATSGGRGGAVQPIAVPEPAVRSAEKRSTLAAGAIALLSMQLGSIRNAERAKAVARLQELGPRIDELRGQGFGVVVTLIVEVPNQIDIAAIWAGIGDVTQVVYYNDMFISYAGPPIKEQPPIKGQRQPQAYRQNYAIGDTDYRGEWYRHHPRKGFRFATSHLQLPAERGLVAPAERKARPILVMRPDKTPRSVHFGADYFLDVNRRINISSAGFEMWNTVTGQRYQRIDKAEEQGRGNAYPSRAKFIHDVPGRPNDRHSIESTFQYSGLEITEYTTFRVLHDKFRDRDDPSITPSEAQVHWVLDQVLWEDMQ